MMSNVCSVYQNGDENNVGRYCFDGAIGDRTWCGTVNDIDVISFVHEHEKEIEITFDWLVIKTHIDIKHTYVIIVYIHLTQKII